MDDPERRAVLALGVVRGVQPVEGAADDGPDDAERNRSRRRPLEAEEARERLALHVVHDQEQLAAERDDVEGRDGVRVADARGQPGLVEEHRDELGIARVLRVQSLDRDRARETNRTEEAPVVDGRHPAGSDLAIERVPSDDSPRPWLGATAHLGRSYQVPIRPDRPVSIGAYWVTSTGVPSTSSAAGSLMIRSLPSRPELISMVAPVSRSTTTGVMWTRLSGVTVAT